MTLIELVARGESHGGERPAMIADERVISYGQLDQEAGALAKQLRRLGLRPGDRVALLLPTLPEYVPAYFGILGAGGVVVPINPRARAPEIRHIVEDCGVRSAIAHVDAVDELRRAVANSPSFSHLVTAGGPAPEGAVALAELVRDPERLDPRCAKSDDLAQICYTSGTTGKPKGVMLSHRNLALNAASLAEACGASPADRMLAVAPLGHILGTSLVMNMTLFSGGALVFCARLDPDTIMGTIARQRCTFVGAVPTVYIMLLNHPRQYDLGSLREAMCGGASCPVEVINAFQKRFGVRILEGYGITEIAGGAAFNPLHGARKPGSVGLPINYMAVAILDDEGRALGPGEVGELSIKGPTVMAGYYGQPDATRETVRDGWLRTGDLASADADGYYFIVDRKKDLIITSGFNVYPREVEEVLYQHPAVAEAGVVGLPDPVKGELVSACVTLRPGAEATEADLIAFCKEQLTPYKAPVRVEFFPALPKGATGKLLRRELRELIAGRS
jgi:long-chain acyl-CoA synthetase